MDGGDSGTPRSDVSRFILFFLCRFFSGVTARDFAGKTITRGNQLILFHDLRAHPSLLTFAKITNDTPERPFQLIICGTPDPSGVRLVNCSVVTPLQPH